jgi:transposase
LDLEISCRNRYRDSTATREKVFMVPIEVITSVQRRRRWSAAEKKAMVHEAEQPGMSISAVARKYGVHPNQVFRWRKLADEGALSAVGADEGVVAASEVKELKRQIREMERLLGRKTKEEEILKEAVQIAREKKLISRVPLLPEDDSR